jgi:hypothetical protein
LQHQVGERPRRLSSGSPLAPGGALAERSRSDPIARRNSAPQLARSLPVSVDYQVRAARITDIDRLVALSAEATSMAAGDAPLVAPDLLRQLVYLPQATVLVVESRRAVIGAAVLALRPSVTAGGFVGTVDLLVSDPDHDVDAVVGVLIEEVMRSAKNKGCTTVEVARPTDPAERARWERRGFGDGGPLLTRPVAAGRTAARAT